MGKFESVQKPIVPTYAQDEWNVERKRLAKLGMAVAEELAVDTKAGGTARIAAARLLLETAGVVGPVRQPGKAQTDAAQLTTEELKRLIEAADSELASRAKPISKPRLPSIEEELFGIVE